MAGDALVDVIHLDPGSCKADAANVQRSGKRRRVFATQGSKFRRGSGAEAEESAPVKFSSIPKGVIASA